MAYRRRHQETPWHSSSFSSSPSFEEEVRNSSSFVAWNEIDDTSSSPSSSSLAAKAIRASSSRRDSSLSSLYGHSNSNAFSIPHPTATATPPFTSKDSRSYGYESTKSLNESTKQGFWGSLSRKAKSILEDGNATQQFQARGDGRGKFRNSDHLEEGNLKRDGQKLLKGLDAITSSLTHIGGTIGKSLEEGFALMENRTSDIIQETRKHIRKKPSDSVGQSQVTNRSTRQQSQLRNPPAPMQTDLELQLKASRDVAMAMSAKAKLLLRELKTVKADLAFAKERCAQLEEENKILLENRERGVRLEDDDMIRLQLETLLAEKARLAHENSVYARENRFLKEVVEYHQLTMQDVVYLDENNEEVTEVNPLILPPAPNMPLESVTPTATSLSLPLDAALGMSSEYTRDVSFPLSVKDAKNSEVVRNITSVPVQDGKTSEVTTSISSLMEEGAK